MEFERNRVVDVAPGVKVKIEWGEEDSPGFFDDIVKYSNRRGEWVGDRKKGVLLGSLHDLSLEFAAMPEYFRDFEAHDVDWLMVDQRFHNMIEAAGFMYDDEEDDEIDAKYDDLANMFYCDISLYEKFEIDFSCRYERNSYRYIELLNHIPHNPKNWSHVTQDMSVDFPPRVGVTQTEKDKLLRHTERWYIYDGPASGVSKYSDEAVLSTIPADVRQRLQIRSMYSSAILDYRFGAAGDKALVEVKVLDYEVIKVTDPQIFKLPDHTSIALADI